jgi:hypothetical protein
MVVQTVGSGSDGMGKGGNGKCVLLRSFFYGVWVLSFEGFDDDVTMSGVRDRI